MFACFKRNLFRDALAAAAVVLGLSGSAADALTVNVSGGQLLGASDVDVGGLLYSVTFQDGSCAALYSGCDEASDFAFTTAAEAEAAAQALLDQVFLDSAFGTFDSDPELTPGIESTTLGVTLTPYAVTGTTAFGFGTLNRGGTTLDSILSGTFSATDVSTSTIFTYAVWIPTPVSAPVPLPPAVLMLLAALGAGFSTRLWSRKPA